MAAGEVSAAYGICVGQGHTVDFARNPMAEFAVYISPTQVSLVSNGRGFEMLWETIEDVKIDTDRSRIFLVLRQRGSVTMLETNASTAEQVRAAWKGKRKRGFWR